MTLRMTDRDQDDILRMTVSAENDMRMTVVSKLKMTLKMTN